MACAVSCWVCIASIVKTAPARSVNAFRSSRTAGISFDFSSTATWPRTAPMPCASAATRCGAFPSLLFAPRTVLPSMAITSRPPASTARVHSQAPSTWSSTSALTRANARRKVDSSAGPRRAQHGQGLRPGIGGPLPDRGERPRPRDHRRDPDGQQPRQRMPAPAPLPRVRDLGKEIEQVLAAGSRDRRRCHRRAGPSRQAIVSVGTSIVPPGPCPPPAGTPGASPAVTT